MSNFPISKYKPAEGLIVRIVDNDEVLTLEFNENLRRHTSNLWWGTAVGFRAMQKAAIAMSEENLWSREPLVVVSGHPGGGVKDSLNYVTGCVDRETLTVMQNPKCENRCNSEMKYEWWVSDGEKTGHIILREDFVPLEFYQLLDHLMYDEYTEEDEHLFESYKVKLSAQIWYEPLEESFRVEFSPALKVGEIPADSDWSPEPKTAAG